MAIKITPTKAKGKPAIKNPLKGKPLPKPKPKPKTRTPIDYLKGSKVIGKTYTAWDNQGQKKPDFGKGAGPGDPYREKTKVVLGKDLKTPNTAHGNVVGRTPVSSGGKDPRTDAIRRRLRGL